MLINEYDCLTEVIVKYMFQCKFERDFAEEKKILLLLTRPCIRIKAGCVRIFESIKSIRPAAGVRTKPMLAVKTGKRFLFTVKSLPTITIESLNVARDTRQKYTYLSVVVGFLADRPCSYGESRSYSTGRGGRRSFVAVAKRRTSCISLLDGSSAASNSSVDDEDSTRRVARNSDGFTFRKVCAPRRRKCRPFAFS